MRFSKNIVILLVLALVACQQKGEIDFSTAQGINDKTVSVLQDSLVLNTNEGLVYYRDEPFTGISVSCFGNGNKASRIDYVKGKKQGTYKKWFEDGSLSFESRYTNGKKQGLTSTWWKNGNLRSQSSFENGIPHGVQKQWYFSGAKFKKINLVQGKEEGLQQSWRENGKIYNNYEAKNGRIFGLKRANLCYELEDEYIK